MVMGIAAGVFPKTTNVTIIGSIEVSATKRSKHIDMCLRQQQLQEDRVIKLLLLGTGESGKSTIAKQLRIIHRKSFTNLERQTFKYVIYSNLIEDVKSVLATMQKYKLSFSNERIQSDVTRFQELAPLLKSGAMTFDCTIANLISRIWSDQGFRWCFTKACECDLADSAEYFFSSIQRLADEVYVPSDDDIVRARLTTTGISEISFTFKDVPFRVIDVGGQRSERRKWLHCFDNTTAVLFIVALSEYNQKLREDNQVNRMKESKALFNEICNNIFFVRQSIIMFLNKTDIFEAKIARIPLTVCFPDYKGPTDCESCKHFIKNQFLRLNRNKNRSIYKHFTNATNPKNIQFVFHASADVILKKNLTIVGLF